MTSETYIRGVLQELDGYRAAPPSSVSRRLRALSRPIALLTNRMIPPAAVEAALNAADWVASASVRKAAISLDFSDLETCDAAAADIRRWALGYAATGGGAAGALGVAGLAVDVPATITLALRTARLTGLCYGFGADTTAERVFILDILQLAGANSASEKAAALQRLAADRTDLPAEAWGQIVNMTGQSAGIQTASRRVAQVLGANLSARKVAQIAPLVGAAIGAGVNAAFQNDVALAARHAYRVRWLAVNEGLIEGSSSEQGEAAG